MATIKAMIVAVATAASLIMTSTQVDAAVINLTEGSTSGYTMTDGNTYVVQNSVTFSNTTAGGSGMSVADNATVVLYIPAGVTLTAKGANGSGQIGGGAGILVPETSVLVITGEGIINATGGNAGNGGNGANGSKGSSIECSYYNYPPYEGASTLVYGTAGKGSSGIGGAGGNGGGGAGAAIGGNGATGGSGGNGATSRAHLSYIHAGPKFCGNGNSGSYGCAGGNGIGMGACYVLGNVDIVVTGGTSGSAGKAGGFADWTYYFYNQHSAEEHFATCGGGGGGGGGAGKSPSCAIGGGGTSGGGGGGGGSGAIACRDNDCYNIYPLTNAHGGSGTGGMSNVSSGTTGASKEKTWGGTYANAIDYQTKPSYFYGGDGGTGGAAGAEGGVGTLYMSPTSTVNVDRETLSATTHPAAQYTITFDVNGGAYSSSAEALTATLGCELPDCIPTPMRRGYLFDGWQTATGEEYYGASGTKSKSDYPATEDIILYAQWYLDEDKLVVPGNTFWLRENAEAGWFVDSDVGDGEVLRSGEIGNSTNSWMETAIVGPASFSFDWKVSCNTRGHYLAWFVDGVEQARIRGVTDWATVAASIPEGEHVVRFDYVKGSTAAAGEDKGQVRNFSIDPVRIETETMQVMWDWTTNYFVSVSTTGFGTADFESGWIADGSNVVVTIAPYIHSYSIALLGDTDGAALDGTNLAFQVCGAALP